MVERKKRKEREKLGLVTRAARYILLPLRLRSALWERTFWAGECGRSPDGVVGKPCSEKVRCRLMGDPAPWRSWFLESPGRGFIDRCQ